MKSLFHISTIILIVLFPLLFGCGNNEEKKSIEIQEESKIVNEAEALLSFLEQSGNFINQKKIPTMVAVDDVYRNIKQYHIVDIRKKSDYINGHIDGAINVKLTELSDYMKNTISASRYTKVVFVCNTNQTASYAAMMFRLLGYGNVYSMKWGMSSCDKNIADSRWGKSISDKYSGELVTKGTPKHKKGNYPQFNTGENNPYKILENRVNQLLERNKFKIKSDEVFVNPEKYYIINYWPLDAYVKGHIQGAVQYSPKKSLTRDSYLSTLPTDKPIVVYCYTGQHAAFVVAYLQILGYDAYTLLYGANGFMHKKLISSGIGHAYNRTDNFKAYPLVKGELPGFITEEATSANEIIVEEDNSPVHIIKKETEEEEEEGGC